MTSSRVPPPSQTESAIGADRSLGPIDKSESEKDEKGSPQSLDRRTFDGNANTREGVRPGSDTRSEIDDGANDNDDDSDNDDANETGTDFFTVCPHEAYLNCLRKHRQQRNHKDSEVLLPRCTRWEQICRKKQQYQHPLTHIKTHDSCLVDFDGPHDPYRPRNWPFYKKVYSTILYGLFTFGSTWASGVFSPAIQQFTREFHRPLEVGVLGVSLLLLGFGLGPLFWAPLSELKGRKFAVMLPYFIAMCFAFAAGSAKDVQTFMLSRFFLGMFSSAPLVNTGGVLSDLWNPQRRGIAMVAYATSVILGPMLSPIAGAAITHSYLRWRWTQYITGIWMGFIWIVGMLILDESYPPVLLKRKARALRITSNNWALHSKHEEADTNAIQIVKSYGGRPFVMLATPICFLMSLYSSFVYAIVYLCLAAIPYAFGEYRHWSPVVRYTPFCALLLGVIVGGIINIANNRLYIKKFKANGNRPVPEARLYPMMAGSVFFTVGMFIFGWTSYPKLFWFGEVVGIFCIGLGFFTIFQAALNYLIDTFGQYSASAVGAQTFLRSCMAAGFPLFARQMYKNLNVYWACTVLGCISLLLLPIPFIFYKYGFRIRKRGKLTRRLMEKKI